MLTPIIVPLGSVCFACVWAIQKFNFTFVYRPTYHGIDLALLGVHRVGYSLLLSLLILTAVFALKSFTPGVGKPISRIPD